MTNRAIDTVCWFTYGKDVRNDLSVPMIRCIFKTLINNKKKGFIYG